MNDHSGGNSFCLNLCAFLAIKLVKFDKCFCVTQKPRFYLILPCILYACHLKRHGILCDQPRWVSRRPNCWLINNLGTAVPTFTETDMWEAPWSGMIAIV